MTDYYPLLSRGVAGLDKNAGEARRVLYDRARAALLAQLRSVTPPLSEAEITRERLALEEAVRKVEAEAARQLRQPALRSEPANEARKTPKPMDSQGAESAPEPRVEPARPEPAPPPIADKKPPGVAEERPRPQEEPAVPRPAPRPRPSVDSSQGASEGIRGLRDVVAETESLGSASAAAARAVREAYPDGGAVREADAPPETATPIGTRGLSPSPSRAAPRPPRPVNPPRTAGLPGAVSRDPEPQDFYPPPPPLEEIGTEARARRRVPGPAPRPLAGVEMEEPNPARRGLVAALLVIVLIGGLGTAAFLQRDRISGWFGVVRSVQTQPQREQPQPGTKNAERVPQEGQPGAPQTAPSAPIPAVAQRVVLYEEDPNNPDGNRYAGSALWRTETISPGPGLSPELAIRADIELPERRMSMTFSVRRNTDPTLPASHTVEIVFNLPADFPFGGVANVPGLLMKESEQTRGAPLSGLAVKVTNNFFLIGLSSAEADLQRNLQLLKERAWFDIPIVYNNGRRSILAVEKGTPGERAFNDAFAAWNR